MGEPFAPIAYVADCIPTRSIAPSPSGRGRERVAISVPGVGPGPVEASAQRVCGRWPHRGVTPAPRNAPQTAGERPLRHERG